jgi:hypothetical protein
VTRSPTSPHSWAAWAAAVAPLPHGLGGAGAPLPHPQVEGVDLPGGGRHEADVDAGGELRSATGRHRQVDGVGVVDQDDEVGVAESRVRRPGYWPSARRAGRR